MRLPFATSIQDTGTELIGPLRMQGVYPRFSRTPAQLHRPGPLLGQHSAEIRRWLE